MSFKIGDLVQVKGFTGRVFEDGFKVVGIFKDNSDIDRFWIEQIGEDPQRLVYREADLVHDTRLNPGDYVIDSDGDRSRVVLVDDPWVLTVYCGDYYTFLLKDVKKVTD